MSLAKRESARSTCKCLQQGVREAAIKVYKLVRDLILGRYDRVR